MAGIEAAFEKRKWNLRDASPIQYFTISSIFGTGYTTLVTHCRVNGLINELKSAALLKYSPAKILQHLIGPTDYKPYFKIIDENAEVSVVDIETGSYIFLPEHTMIEGDHLHKLKKVEVGEAFVAEKPGIIRAVASSKGYFIRIQNAGYNGLAEYRHLED